MNQSDKRRFANGEGLPDNLKNLRNMGSCFKDTFTISQTSNGIKRASEVGVGCQQSIKRNAKYNPRRTKFSHDPNNTNWSRSESKYGQRILQSQGWRPGDYLGVKDASHAKYHTVANASHIKVALREENLGLGARVGAAGGEWETTGLDGFQDLLGRLNGKSQEELGKAQTNRETAKRSLYTERRWGTLRFVSGGLLVGDKIDEANEDGGLKDTPLAKVAQATASVALPTLDQKPQEAEKSQSKSGQKSKKLRKGNARSALTQCDDVESEENTNTASNPPAAPADDKAQRRVEKAQRKLQRRLRREARQEKKIRNLAKGSELSPSVEAIHNEREAARDITASSQVRNGIQSVRHRHIMQKKLAMADSKALKEVK